MKPRAIYTTGPNFNARALRDGDWKLVVTRKGVSKKANTPSPEMIELFNIAIDPDETTNLSTQEPAKVVELRARMAELAKADRDAVADD